MTITPEQLLVKVTATVDAQQVWIEALIFEKLGFNWGSSALAAGEHNIALPQPFAAGDLDYEITAKAITLEGDDIGFVLKEKHEGYFKIWLDAACVFSYYTINPKLAVAL